ncbi:zinc metalloprotease HtpX [Candidatus Woesearchaeota archaeon]|nr:zinc metalloprotease HtpX [Candidatus Woesearchaeota archaeon]
MIKNQLKTVLLLGALTGLMLFVGQFIGGTTGLTIALILALSLNFIVYLFSDKIVLAMYRARQAERGSELYSIVKEVARKANLPTPKVYIINSANPNAFATGRNPKNSAVACTTGILDLLNKEELEGVIAHELSHIKNRDTLIATIAAAIAGVISYVAAMARWTAIFGGYDSRDRRGGSGIELLVLAVLTPIIATLIQLAISRSREYIADESAARLLHNHKGLSNALLKLEQGTKLRPMAKGNEATASLFIVNPFSGQALINLFSTHPPISKRVEKLNSLKL